jgi:hypothetical protein
MAGRGEAPESANNEWLRAVAGVEESVASGAVDAAAFWRVKVLVVWLSSLTCRAGCGCWSTRRAARKPRIACRQRWRSNERRWD